jgi:citrate lyase subunit beta/citryl-CoA lyase
MTDSDLRRASLSVGPAFLFCPANRPERFAKAAVRSDAVILDLEDAVPAAEKEAARRAIADSALDASRTLIRVNTGSEAELENDLAMLSGTDYRYLVAGKCESTAMLDRLADYDVVPQIETPKGYLALSEIAAHPAVVALFWGSEDFVHLLGGTASRDSEGRLVDALRIVRASILLVAASVEKATIDAPYTNYSDLTGLEVQAQDAARSGFIGTACVHPNQVAVVRSAYRPTAETVDWASRVVADAADNQGAFATAGAMIDAPLVEQARRVLARASALAS